MSRDLDDLHDAATAAAAVEYDLGRSVDALNGHLQTLAFQGSRHTRLEEALSLLKTAQRALDDAMNILEEELEEGDDE